MSSLESGRYQPSVDQRTLASTIADALVDLLPISRLHQSVSESDGTWAELEALGLFGISLDEANGGSGLGATEEAMIASTLGRCLVDPSVVATLGVGGLGPSSQGPGPSAGGRATFAYGADGKIVLLDDAKAEVILLRSERPTLHGVVAERRRHADDRWTVTFSEIDEAGPSQRALEPRQALRLRLLDAAVLAGLSEAAMEMGVAYAGLREQFGRPIGSYQAVKHRCADMAVASRGAMDLVTFAAVAFDDHRSDAAMLIESAVLMAGTAALENARANIQIHGGIGFSDEADPHLILKRVQVYLAIAGGVEAATDRIACAPCGQA